MCRVFGETTCNRLLHEGSAQVEVFIGFYVVKRVYARLFGSFGSSLKNLKLWTLLLAFLDVESSRFRALKLKRFRVVAIVLCHSFWGIL